MDDKILSSIPLDILPGVLALVESIPLALTITEGPDHRILLLNEISSKIQFNTTPQVITGKSFREVIKVFPLAEEAIKILDSVYQNGQVFELKDVEYGTTIQGLKQKSYWTSRVHPYFDQANPAKVRGLVMYAYETTEQVEVRRRIQQAAQVEAERAQELRTIFDNISDGVIVTGSVGNIVSVNKAATQMLSITQEELKHNPKILAENLRGFYLDGTPVKDNEWPGTIARLQKRQASGDFICLLKGDQKFFCHASSNPILDENSEVRLIVHLFRDIKPLMEAEQRQKELLESLEAETSKLAAIINSINACLVVANLENQVLIVNRQLLQESKNTIHNFVGHHISEVVEYYLSLVDNRDTIRNQVSSFLEKRHEPQNIEVHFGAPFNKDYKVLTFPIFDRNNVQLGWGALLDDVTRSIQLLKLRSQFVATASHELRTPLTGIVGFAELLLSREVKPGIRDIWIKNIYNEGLRVSRIIENMLNISRLEAGVLQLNLTEFSLPSAIKKVIQDTHDSYNEILVEFDERNIASPDCMVFADETRITEVLKQVLSNAVKFNCSELPVLVTLQNVVNLEIPGNGKKEDQPEYSSNRKTREWVVVKVHDNGSGILPEDMPHIFEPFYRAKTISLNTAAGSGLGLSLALKLIEMHGGYIWAESTPGEGCTFSVALPKLVNELTTHH